MNNALSGNSFHMKCFTFKCHCRSIQAHMSQTTHKHNTIRHKSVRANSIISRISMSTTNSTLDGSNLKRKKRLMMLYRNMMAFGHLRHQKEWFWEMIWVWCWKARHAIRLFRRVSSNRSFSRISRLSFNTRCNYRTARSVAALIWSYCHRARKRQIWKR